MMHDDPSGLLSSCDLRIVGKSNVSDSSMVKQEQSNFHQYLHHQQQHSIQHSDSSRSSSISSSSFSPRTLALTSATNPSTSTTTVPSVTVTGVTAVLSDIDPKLAQDVEYELGLTKKNGSTSGTRKNAWGNLSYAELISKAITSSAEQRLTLSEIYDWMIKYVPFFRNKVDRVSSAGWKNSIRHNLSLHNRFKRVQSEGSGKSSWWMINPDDGTDGHGTTSNTASGTKQTRRRLGHGTKSPAVSAVTTNKRTKTSKSNKSSRDLLSRVQQQEQQKKSTTQLVTPSERPAVIYETQSWVNHAETDMTANHLYEPELYSASVTTPTTNSSINSTGCISSAYSYDDGTSNYTTNGSSVNTNTGDYSYHHSHYHHHHHPHPHPHPHPQTLYQQHHGSNYEMVSTNGYYIQQQQLPSVLNDHSTNTCSLSIDTYHPTNTNSYGLTSQPSIDPNDEQPFLRVHSTSSHSSTASLSPPTLTTNTNLVPSSSSGSSSANYSHSHKSSSSGNYLHPTSNGTLTLYSHHHQTHLTHLPHSHRAEMGTLLHLNIERDEMDEDDDEDDISTLVHHPHHGLVDGHPSLSSFYLNTMGHHSYLHPINSIHSDNETSTSLLRTVLNRPIVDMQNHQV